MTVIDKINEINNIVKDIFDFTQSNEIVKEDFEEYLRTIGAGNITLNQMEKVFLPYIFERRIKDKSILEMFAEETKEKEITEALIKAQSSIYQIKRILKNGFELYNLINEKTYTVLSLTKMTNFRGVYAGQYIVARIFEFRGEYYVIEISSILSHSQKNEAMRYAVMKLVQNPKLLYIDNEEKENEIKAVVSEMYEKFTKTFDQDIILTTNKYADDIIGAFNDGEEVDLSDKGSNLENPKFFHVKELDNNYSNFLENSLGGFSSHTEEYDVAVIFDKEKGWFRPRKADGTWVEWPENARLKEWYECIEANSYQQGWFVPHDVPGMVNLMGGKEKVIADLTDFFNKTPSNMLWNEYYNHANEPVHFVPFLFNQLEVPWYTQKWTRYTCEKAYANKVEGIVGNEDVGQMSAWYVLAASGIHPSCPGNTRMEITSPVFDKVEFNLDLSYYTGKKFTVIAHNNSINNVYIQKALLNGQEYNKCYLDFADIAAGGTLELFMGDKPNVEWGI